MTIAKRNKCRAKAGVGNIQFRTEISLCCSKLSRIRTCKAYFKHLCARDSHSAFTTRNAMRKASLSRKIRKAQENCNKQRRGKNKVSNIRRAPPKKPVVSALVYSVVKKKMVRPQR